MPDLRVSRDADLNEIFLKCVDANTAIEYSLNENSLQFLITEQIDEADINKVRNAIETAAKQIALARGVGDASSVQTTTQGAGRTTHKSPPTHKEQRVGICLD